MQRSQELLSILVRLSCHQLSGDGRVLRPGRMWMTHSHFSLAWQSWESWEWLALVHLLCIFASLGRLSSDSFPSLPALISVAIPVVKRSWKGEIKYSGEKKLFQLTAGPWCTFFYYCLFNFHNTTLYCQIPGRPLCPLQFSRWFD